MYINIYSRTAKIMPGCTLLPAVTLLSKNTITTNGECLVGRSGYSYENVIGS